MNRSPKARRVRTLATALVAALALAACSGSDTVDTLTLDWATYNPLSLVIREQGWLEEALADDGITVEWIQSAGSNRANEGLRSNTLDIGSTAGSAALLARANGSPIKAISLYSQPEWATLVVRGDSDITELEDLAGTSIAATRGTDPYFFLLQALELAGIGLDEVEINNLQHADGRSALENRSVDVWAGLDPITAASEAESGSQLLFRDISFNTWGFLNATEDFLAAAPELAQLVVDAYELARQWALDNPEETAELLAREAGIDVEVARTVLLERTNLEISPIPGPTQRAVLEIVGPILVDTGDVQTQGDVDTALDSLFEPRFAEAADPSRVNGA